MILDKESAGEHLARGAVARNADVPASTRNDEMLQQSVTPMATPVAGTELRALMAQFKAGELG